MHQVGLPSDTRRDVWFKFRNVAGALTVKAFATRALAHATNGEYLADATITPGASAQTVTLTDNASTDPDMTGLQIVGVFNALPANPGQVWGYTCAPELVTADNFRTRIVASSDAGYPFESITAANIALGDATVPEAPIGLNIRPGKPRIVESSSAGALIGWHVPIDVYVMVDSAESEEDAWLTARAYMNGLVSLLCDENTESYGEVLQITYEDMDGPIFGEIATRCIGGVTFVAEYHAVWRDDEFPRH